MQEAFNLIEIRNSYGLSQTDFARKVKMSRELVSKIENGKAPLNKPTLKKIRQFLEANPRSFSHDVNFLGKASQHQRRSATPYYEQRRGQKNDGAAFLVPLVGIKAQAGYIKGFEQTDYMEALEQYSLPPGVNPTGAIWRYFEVDGDSMEPTLYPGDIILASMLAHEDWNDVKNYSVYIILTADQLLVKRIFRKNEKHWVLISDNDESYPQVILNTDDVKQVWTFRRQIRSKIPSPKEIKITA